MPRYDVRCPHCGRDAELIAQWHERDVPCAACGTATIRMWFESAAVIGDEIPGGQVIETLDHEPLTFYSQSAIRAAAEARGLRLVDKWAGPQDKYLTNWAAGMDAQTLKNAAALVSRGVRVGDAEDPARLTTYQGQSRTITKWSEVE